MRLGRPLLVILALLIILVGVPSLTAMDSRDPGWVNQNDIGESNDGGTTDGDPWQDDDDGGPTVVGDNDGGSGFTVILKLNFTWPFIDVVVVHGTKSSLNMVKPGYPKPGTRVSLKHFTK
jgi:hypothetical protein